MDRAPVFGTGCWGFESLLGHHSLGLLKARRGEILPAPFCAIQPKYSRTYGTDAAQFAIAKHTPPIQARGFPRPAWRHRDRRVCRSAIGMLVGRLCLRGRLT